MQIPGSGRLAYLQSRRDLPRLSPHLADSRFNRLSFGISSAPEHLQKLTSQVLEGTEGTLCQMDDILVFGKSVREHDEHLKATPHKLQKANLTLNEEKCEFSKPSVQFLGTVMDSNGVLADPKKVEAVLQKERPKDQSELVRFLGMVNQLSKSQPQIAERSKPLRDLLSSKNHWSLGEAQQDAFSSLRTVPTIVIAHTFCASRDTRISYC